MGLVRFTGWRGGDVHRNLGMPHVHKRGGGFFNTSTLDGRVESMWVSWTRKRGYPGRDVEEEGWWECEKGLVGVLSV